MEVCQLSKGEVAQSSTQDEHQTYFFFFKETLKKENWLQKEKSKYL